MLKVQISVTYGRELVSSSTASTTSPSRITDNPGRKQAPRADSTRIRYRAIRTPNPLYPDLTHKCHLVAQKADAASAAEDRTLNTWRRAFKPVY